MSARKTTRTKRTTKRAARPAARRRDRDFTARLVERLVGAGVPVVEALLSEEIGEDVRARRGLDDGRKMLRALAESLHGRGDVYGPILLGSVKVRRALDLSWMRAREGSAEDIALVVAIGEALVRLKRRNATANLKTREDLAEADFHRLDRLIPRERAEALRYADPPFLDARLRELSREGRTSDMNALTTLCGHPEAVDLLIGARVSRKKTGPFPYRRLARSLVRPLEPKDADTVRRARDAERAARRAAAKSRPPA